MASNSREAPLAHHTQKSAEFAGVAAALDGKALRLSFVQLALFGIAVVSGIAIIALSSPLYGIALAVSSLLFVVARVLHVRTTTARDHALVRKAIHDRHIARLKGEWLTFVSDGGKLVPQDHAYAHDIDLVGPGSLFQRIDVTHTTHGEATLARFLSAPADLATIERRQAAVRELAANRELLRELEASVETVVGLEKLDGTPFLAFTKLPSFFATARWLVPVIHVTPLLLLALYVASEADLVPYYAFVALVFVQAAIWLRTTKHAAAAFELVTARRGFADAFQRLLQLVERTKFESAELRRIGEKLALGEKTPSAMLARLDRWAGLAELRTQPLFWVPANVLTLFDLHVLMRLERWNADVGTRFDDFLHTIGELEALASLATLADQDPLATFPEIRGEGLVAEGLAHPLLEESARVANDVTLDGPGCALVVTGSNMAGKSTLLRSVGLAMALAQAGGPVPARAMRLGPVRLRASMRATDSLQRGASYFHAELEKLRAVVADAESSPPIFFLLDELLRGTNARARHLGARAVILHLMKRGALGLVATHDTALAALETELAGRVKNAHFTDVVVEGEMTFDYRLREGVVRTSNALRLLRMAGVDVDDRDDGAELDASAK